MANEMPINIGEMLDEVSTKLPKLINSLLSTLYSAEIGTHMGQAVGNFYKELVQAGIPEAEALSMAKDYVQTLKGITQAFKQ